MLKKYSQTVIWRFILISILIFGMLGFRPVQPVHAATLTVTNTNDSGPGSLRQAITNAASGDTITFDKSLSGKTITLLSMLQIDKDLTIDGSTLLSGIIISGNNNVSIFENLTTTTLKGLNIANGNGADLYRGGGVANYDGTLSIVNCSIFANSATEGGGIYNAGILNITDSTVSSNSATYGGGINNSGTLNISNSFLSDNSSDFGGGILNDGGGDNSINIKDSTISNNSAAYSGGGIYSVNGLLQVINSVFSNNAAIQAGGAIYTNIFGELTINNSRFTSNTSETGGAILNNTNMTVEDSTFENNSVTSAGGAIRNGGNLTIKNSTITHSQADSGGAIIVQGNENTTIINSTVANNDGGGIEIQGNTLVEIINSTFANNSTVSEPEIDQSGGSGLKLVNSIFVCPSQIAHCYEVMGPNTINSILGVGTLQDFGLTELADNGGPTQTMALQPGSSLIDAGDDASCPEIDQRGVPRPQGSHCDIGAYEDQSLIHYVKWNAAGANNGTSWADAFSDLQSALSAASAGDEIWVAAGTYKPTSGPDRSISFVLKNGVVLYGGFAGTETMLSQRNYETNVTLLSGDIGSAGIKSDNSYHVVVTSNTNNSAWLDGFTITAGNASGTTTNETNGGGIYNDWGNPVIKNSIVSGNSATFGGGMYNNFFGMHEPNETNKPILTNVIFRDNSAVEGGGIENQFFSSPALIDVTFSHNSSTRAGGGMSNYWYSSPTLTSVTFRDNTAGGGGGVSNWDNCNPILKNVTFYGNSASFGGAIANGGTSSTSITNATFSQNTSEQGGAIYNEYGNTVNVINSILHNDAASEIYNTGQVMVAYSIVQGGYTGTGNLDVDPLLSLLQDNGGFTQTMALAPNSPAIDAGDDENCPQTDQRGVSRPQGSHCDIGAYEYRGSPAIHYVRKSASGGNNGTSWDDAFTNLQSALSTATSGDEIWVAAGTYKPTTGTDRTISFVLKNGVAIYGGFAGTETLLTQRDPAANVTILSGDVGVADNKSDNSYHVVVANSVDNGTLLDGFTITDGNANGISPYDSGGGMYSDKGSLKLNDIIFTDNYAAILGGGLYTFYTDGEGQAVDLHLTDVIFGNNNSGGEGGGMAARFMPISSATFGLELTNVNFTNNVANRTGGGMSNEGSSLTLLDVTFSGNTALGGGGLSNIPYGSTTLTNVMFSNNSAHDGGGGMLVGSDGPTLTTLTDVTFDHNSTAINGGAIANAGYSDLTLTNVTFSENTAGANGGGISNGGFLDIESGGTIDLLNTTFSNNFSSANGSAIYNESGNVNIHNSILYGTSEKEIYGTADVTYSIVHGGYDGIGNLDADPLLGPLQDNGGFTQTMALASNSPAINAGNDSGCPETDQRGVTRPQGSHCDIGAYEKEMFVTITGNAWADGVMFSYTDKTPKTVVSDSKGNYSLTVPYGWSGTLTSAHSCFTFDPPYFDYSSVTTDQTNQNFGPIIKPGCANMGVFVGGISIGSYGLPHYSSKRLNYPGINSGPALVVTNSTLVASERFIYSDNGVPVSYSEMMGYPTNRVTTGYYFPWYNNVNMWTQLRFANTTSNMSTMVSVFLGTNLLGSYPLSPRQSLRVDYPGVNGGPLKVVSSGGVPIIAAERIIYSEGNGSAQNGKHTSYFELMGYPPTQFSSEYWIPWYNNVNMWTQLRFANPIAGGEATVSVYLGNTLLESFKLAASASHRAEYVGINGGPLHIVSNRLILVSERVIYSVGGVQNGTHTSYSELMAIPSSQLSSEYYFPSYSYPDSGTWSQLRIANPSSSQGTTVQVYLGASLMGSYPLGPAQSIRVDYPGADGGPMQVVSTNANVRILTAMRVIQSVNGVQTSYSEIAGLPISWLTSAYWFPWYNNVNFDTQLRIGIP